jgi:hypothetical protein
VDASRKLIVTSRSSHAGRVLSGSSTPRSNSATINVGEAECVADELFDAHMSREPHLSNEARAWIEARRAVVTSMLTRPPSFDRFVARVANLPNAERTDAAFETILREARDAEFGPELRNTFDGVPDGERRGLAALWLALNAWRGSSTFDQDVDALDRALHDRDVELERVYQTMQRLRWIRPSNAGVEMHPSYEAALLQLVESWRQLAVDVVALAMGALLDAGKRTAAWKAWKAIEPTQLADGFVLAADVREAAREAVVMGTDGGAAPQAEYLEALRAVAANAAAEDVVGQIAVALVALESHTGWTPEDSWKRPDWDSNFWTQVHASSEAAQAVHQFVRRMFPTAPPWLLFIDDAEPFVAFLYEVADVSEAFEALLDKIEDNDAYGRGALIAAGAVRSSTVDRDRLVARAVAIAENVQRWQEGIEAKADGDPEYWEHYNGIRDERRAPAEALVDSVLRERAKAGERDWARHRTEAIVFERFAKRCRWEEHDVGTIRSVLLVAPPEGRVEIVEELSAATPSLEIIPAVVLGVLDLVPSSRWSAILGTLERRFDLYVHPGIADRLVQASSLRAHERVALVAVRGPGARRRAGEWPRPQ